MLTRWSAMQRSEATEQPNFLQVKSVSPGDVLTQNV